jgi:hypothetical protein
MYRPHIIFRIQIAVLAATGILTFIFITLYQPLTRRAKETDQSIQTVWLQLANLNSKFKGGLGMDFQTCAGNRRLAAKSLSAMQKAAREECGRISLAQEWRGRILQPFAFMDFNYMRQQLIQELQQAAQSGNVALDPSVSAGAYPDYQPNQSNTAQLWAQLFISDQILRTAVASGVKNIKSATPLPVAVHPSLDDGRNVLDEHCLRLELTGTASAVFNFLRSLPLRLEELKALGLPASSETKPALFLKRFVIKRDFSDPNELSLDAVISGLAARDLEPQ